MSKRTIDSYLAKTAEPQRGTLRSLRRVLRRILPHAEEALSYGMPCFQVDGQGVAGFAALQRHCSYFPMSGSVIRQMRTDLARYQLSTGGFRFPVDEVPPAALVRKLVRARLRQLSAPPKSGTGIARVCYDDGALRSRGRYKGGKRHGKWSFFRRDGSVIRTGAFRRGVPSGIWRTWDRKGRLVRETRL